MKLTALSPSPLICLNMIKDRHQTGFIALHLCLYGINLNLRMCFNYWGNNIWNLLQIFLKHAYYYHSCSSGLNIVLLYSLQCWLLMWNFFKVWSPVSFVCLLLLISLLNFPSVMRTKDILSSSLIRDSPANADAAVSSYDTTTK